MSVVFGGLDLCFHGWLESIYPTGKAGEYELKFTHAAISTDQGTITSFIYVQASLSRKVAASKCYARLEPMPRRNSPKLLLLAPLVVLAPFGVAQRAALRVGDVDLELGASVERSIASLKRSFQVQDAEGKSSHFWLISKRTEDFPFATVYSKGNAIIGVKHDLLEREPGSTEDVFNALFRAASHAKTLTDKPCSPETNSTYSADDTVPLAKTTVYFLCGDYSFYLLRNVFSSEGKMVAAFVAIEEIGLVE